MSDTATPTPPGPPPTAGGFGAGARALSAANVAVLITLAMVAVILANLVVSRSYVRFDWTHGGAYQLSARTKAYLASLDKPLRIIVFYPPARAPEPFLVHNLAREYALASSRITVETFDPERDPHGTKALLEAFKVNADDMRAGGVVVFEYAGDRVKYVTHAKLFEADLSQMRMGGREQQTFKGEDQFTSAIVSLREAKKPKAGFLVGHGELDPVAPEPEHAATKARETLWRDLFDVETIDLTGKDRIPEGFDCVIIARPRREIPAVEVNALAEYVKAGGNVVALLRSEVVKFQDLFQFVETGLEPLLREHGFVLGKDIIVDDVQLTGGYIPGNQAFFPVFSGRHEVTRDFGPDSGRIVEWHRVRSVRYDDQGQGKTIGEAIAHTSGKGRIITDFLTLDALTRDPRKRRDWLESLPADQVPIAAASEAIQPAANGRQPRVVVFGSAEWLADDAGGDAMLGQNLFLNAVNWASRRENLIGITPRKATETKFQMSPSDLSLVAWTAFLLLPGFIAGLGVLVWQLRRMDAPAGGKPK